MIRVTTLCVFALLLAGPALAAGQPPREFESRLEALEARLSSVETRLAALAACPAPPPVVQAATAAPAAPRLLAESAPAWPQSAAPLYPAPATGGPWAWDGSENCWRSPNPVTTSVGSGGPVTPSGAVYHGGPANAASGWLMPPPQLQPLAAPPAYLAPLPLSAFQGWTCSGGNCHR